MVEVFGGVDFRVYCLMVYDVVVMLVVWLGFEKWCGIDVVDVEIG